MSWQPCEDPAEHEAPPDPSVETIVVPRTSDLGGFSVRRALPSAGRRTVGGFVFLDQMGPAIFDAGKGIDVRPHPHIGLATFTYLFEGAILHRDSVGSVQPITPGAVNWMTAGRGIVHSERTAPELRATPQPLFGMQLWVALPAAREETDPDFAHYPAAAIPATEGEGVSARVVVGEGFGLRAPVATLSDLFFFDLTMAAGATVAVPADHVERALYLVEGRVAIDGVPHEPGRLLVLAPGRPVAVRAETPARLAALGGEPLDGPRHLWWNFVSSRRERIEQAKADWKRDRFALPVPDETEFIPLPD
ncbi:MAG: pirin family protein [Alphaproteobacteria bacterium]